MNRVLITEVASFAYLTLLVACASESGPAAPGLQTMAFAGSEWSERLNASNRAGGSGGTDIWMSIRTPSGH